LASLRGTENWTDYVPIQYDPQSTTFSPSIFKGDANGDGLNSVKDIPTEPGERSVDKGESPNLGLPSKVSSIIIERPDEVLVPVDNFIRY
jgi:hypothetical protein